MATVAQDGDPVGNLEHLFQPVRDEDDAQPLSLEVTDDLHEVFHLAFGKRRGRLVHDDNPGLNG